jgi:hypothetical protein
MEQAWPKDVLTTVHRPLQSSYLALVDLTILSLYLFGEPWSPQAHKPARCIGKK